MDSRLYPINSGSLGEPRRPSGFMTTMERHPSARIRADHDPRPTSFSNATILIVEDDDNSLFVLKGILRTKGYRVLEACDGKQAVEDATKACELSEWQNPLYLAGLAMAYAESGDFDAALKWQQKAIELSPSPPASMLSNLELFKQHKSFRMTWR